MTNIEQVLIIFLPVVLRLTEPVHQDDHQGGGGDLEAGQGSKDGLEKIFRMLGESHLGFL